MTKPTERTIVIKSLCRDDAEDRWGYEIRAAEDMEARGHGYHPSSAFLLTARTVLGSWAEVLHVLEHGQTRRDAT